LGRNILAGGWLEILFSLHAGDTVYAAFPFESVSLCQLVDIFLP
jgi:hypothetical protein